jgi:nicotinate-nucleotide adenylyltransferase
LSICASSESLGRDRSPRVGLFGGTFNPIHLGHTQAAKDVAQKFRLTSIDFLPSALPPHKTKGILAAAADRYKMACMALADEPAFTVSDVEIKRTGPSYTIDTLRTYISGCPGGTQLFFLVGLDAFLEIHTWKSFRHLFDLAAFIVMTRPSGMASNSPWQESVARFTRNHISEAYLPSGQGDALIHPRKKPIYLVSVSPVAISSSRIRELIRKGQSVEQWVAPAVAAYIEGKGLYR